MYGDGNVKDAIFYNTCPHKCKIDVIFLTPFLKKPYNFVVYQMIHPYLEIIER